MDKDQEKGGTATVAEPPSITAARELLASYDKDRSKFSNSAGRLPHVLKVNYDVRRGDQIARIPAGTVIEDADLTDDEWDHLLAENLVAEATVSQMREHEAKLKRDEAAAHERTKKRQAATGRAKSGRGTKIPAGATVVSDLAAGTAEGARAAALRQAALAGNASALAPAPTAAQLEEARAAGEAQRAEEERLAREAEDQVKRDAAKAAKKDKKANGGGEGLGTPIGGHSTGTGTDAGAGE